MIPKYHIEYAIELGGHREPHVRDFQTDDPVACEGVDVLVKNAANTLAAKHVAKSLGLNAEQVHYRFGLAA